MNAARRLTALLVGCAAGVVLSEGCRCPALALNGVEMTLEAHQVGDLLVHPIDTAAPSAPGFAIELIMDSETVVLIFENDEDWAAVEYERPAEYANGRPRGFL